MFTPEEKKAFLKKEPVAKKYFKQWYGADEFINNRPRWCLYLGNCTPDQLKKMPQCLKRVAKVRAYRLKSKRISTVKAADYPTKFGLEVFPKTPFLVIPVVSSARRSYIPMGFMTPKSFFSNQVNLIPHATLYHFGVLTSKVHMIWVRAICGRLKSDYRYSKDIVYNNFPWCNATEKQRAKIEKTAQAILDVRAKYSTSSLSDLYDELTMPFDLRKAHKANDKAVLEAYGLSDKMSENEIVTQLFKLYAVLSTKASL